LSPHTEDDNLNQASLILYGYETGEHQILKPPVNKEKMRNLFPQQTSFKEAYPEIKSLRIEISQDRFGFYTQPQNDQKIILTESNITPKIPCINPLCQRGGINIEKLVSFMIPHRSQEDEFEETCPGHEGSTRNRSAPPCDNTSIVKISIIYK